MFIDSSTIPWKERVFMLVLSVTHAMQHFVGKVFPPLIPVLATDLRLPLWKLGTLVTLWTLTNGVFQAPMGHLSDRFDRRYILPTGVAIVGLGYLIVAASTVLGASLEPITIFGTTWTGTVVFMALGMVVAGLGKSATHPTGYPLISANVPLERKGKALGRWSGGAKLGNAAGPAFVAVAILVLVWQEVFYLIAAVSISYAFFLFIFMARSAIVTVPERERPETTDGDGSKYRLSLALLLLSMITAAVASRGVGTYFPEFVTRVYGYSFTFLGVGFRPESVASIYFSIVLLTAAVASLVIGKLVDTHDPRTILIGLMVGATATLLALSFVPLGPFGLLAISVLIGATLYGVSPARDAIVTAVTPPEREGRTFGYFWMLYLLVTSTFPAIIGYISDVAGIQQGFLYLGGGTLLAIVPLLVLTRWKLPAMDGEQKH